MLGQPRVGGCHTLSTVHFTGFPTTTQTAPSRSRDSRRSPTSPWGSTTHARCASTSTWSAGVTTRYGQLGRRHVRRALGCGRRARHLRRDRRGGWRSTTVRASVRRHRLLLGHKQSWRARRAHGHGQVGEPAEGLRTQRRHFARDAGLRRLRGRAAGVVTCWGSGDLGRLGDGQFSTQYSAGEGHGGKPRQANRRCGPSYWGSCEIADGGRVWCWGEETRGALATIRRRTPTPGPARGTPSVSPTRPTKVRLLSPAPGKPTGSSTTSKKITITWAAPSTAYGTATPSDYVIKYRLKGTSTWKTFRDAGNGVARRDRNRSVERQVLPVPCLPEELGWHRNSVRDVGLYQVEVGDR